MWRPGGKRRPRVLEKLTFPIILRAAGFADSEKRRIFGSGHVGDGRLAVGVFHAEGELALWIVIVVGR
jgi:hypothetical protein